MSASSAAQTPGWPNVTESGPSVIEDSQGEPVVVGRVGDHVVLGDHPVPDRSSRHALRERSMSGHTRPTTVVSHPAKSVRRWCRCLRISASRDRFSCWPWARWCYD
jgi:hypothetical protein